MCQYACNQQETFVPPTLMNLKSINDLVTDYGMEFDVDTYALMNLDECFDLCMANRWVSGKSYNEQK